MKKSALFFDIDGTILSEITKEIPESALEALNQAKKNGHKMDVDVIWCATMRSCWRAI